MSRPVFEVPTPKSMLDENRFFFAIPVNGKKKELSFPKFQYFDRKYTRLMQAQSAQRKKRIDAKEQILMVDEVEEWLELYTAFYPDLKEAFEALSDDQVMAISNAWLEASQPEIPEEDLPESEASSNS